MKYERHDDRVTLTLTIDGVNDNEDICLIDLDTALDLFAKTTLDFINLYEKRRRECDLV